MLARYVGDIDEAVEVSANAGRRSGVVTITFGHVTLPCVFIGLLLHSASLALASARPDLIDTVIADKVPSARDVLLKELGRRRERVRLLLLLLLLLILLLLLLLLLLILLLLLLLLTGLLLFRFLL